MKIYQKCKQILTHSLTKPLVKWGIFVSSIFLLFTVIGPNLQWFASPFTPKIEGKVLDSQSGKPIRGLQILISHQIRYTYIPGNGYIDYAKSTIVKTDNNGDFAFGAIIKPISFSFFGLFDKKYDGPHILTIDSNYEYQVKVLSESSIVKLELRKISSKNSAHENYEVYQLFSKHNYPKYIRNILIDCEKESLLKSKYID